ncbi:MAG: metal ABC transporter permease [Calditrichaeota bacterium]|nr:MAG: metal ABC transporter permease [Calditrichota bacterium]
MFEMMGIDFMVNALFACLIFGLLLSYLGIHVVGRGIVFVDLALGQISSFGVAISDYFHMGHLWLPVAFTLVGAFLLSLIHIHDKRLKLEAIIGIIYVATSAFTVLVISKTPHGESNIQEVLFGALFATTSVDIFRMLGAFGLLAILHFAFHKHLYRMTELIQSGDDSQFGLKERAWNFFFYMSIGLSIVLAVRLGGVLPVFSYLVVPAVSAVMLARNKAAIVLVALLNSALAGFFGLWLSYTYDFPAGPSIVAIFAVIFVVATILRFVRLRFFNVTFEEERV